MDLIKYETLYLVVQAAVVAQNLKGDGIRFGGLHLFVAWAINLLCFYVGCQWLYL